MALEASSSNELLNLIIYDTISATPFSCHDSTETTFFHLNPPPMEIMSSNSSLTTTASKTSTAGQPYSSHGTPENNQNLGVHGGGGRKKRRKKPRVCKNKEEAETQRMTHIAIERNRRKQMNEHLSVLLSLMPESYVQRGDQASIVGGAIEFVKELGYILQSLEAQKFLLTQQEVGINHVQNSNFANDPTNHLCKLKKLWCTTTAPPFSQFFSFPQYTWSQIPNKNTSKSKASMADIEVNLVQTHANLRILSPKWLTQLSKLVVFLQTLSLSILHLNVTTMDPLVLYSISLKVEEGCWLNSADEIAGAVHQILRIIEEEAALCADSIN